MDNLSTIIVCICFSILFSFVAVVASRPRRLLTKFWIRLGFRGEADGKLPRYLGKCSISTYLKRLRFKSTVPLDRWERAKSDIEMFYKRNIYKIEQSRKDIRVMDIYLVEENLPSYIEWRDDFMESGSAFAIGESYNGKVVWDAAALPHGLVAGATGSGKTGVLRCIIHQAIMKRWNVSVLDFKGGGDYVAAERNVNNFQNLEQNYGSFITSDPKEARDLLLALTIEVDGRSAAFKKAGVSKIEEYNASGLGHFVPWLVIVDEAAELFDVRPKSKEEKELYAEIDGLFRTLARKSRAAGVHILMGFIRPDANVLDGQIKNNLLWRVCGYFSDPAASRIVLDSDRATELPPEVKGRFIVGDEEVQAYYMPIPKPEK